MKFIETNEPFVLLNNLTAEQIIAIKAVFNAKVISESVVAPSTAPSNSSGLIISDFKISVNCDADSGKQKNVSWTTNVPSEVIIGDYVGKNSIWMTPSSTWKLKIREKGTSNYIEVEVNSGACGTPGSYKIGAMTVMSEVSTVTNTTTVNTAPITNTTYGSSYAQIGSVYEAKEKPRLHCSSHNDNNHAQYYSVKRNGQIIYEMNNIEGWHPSTIYWGNHPKETIIPIEEGQYNFYFKNNSSVATIIGVTSGDPYGQYTKGGLAGTRFWKQLEQGQDVSFSLDLQDTEDRSFLLGNWDKSQNSFFLTCPLYENGRITTDKIEVEGCPNGLELPENGKQLVKMYKLIDPSKNIVIEVNTTGIFHNATYKLISKNGLDIDPNHVMITAYNTSYHKIFNNDASGYIL